MSDGLKITLFIHDRKAVVQKLLLVKPSPARNQLIALLKVSKTDLIQAVVDTWFQLHYGVRPLQTTLQIPLQLLPKIDDPAEFYQYVTDNLKKSI